jgi:hypothetical protein
MTMPSDASAVLPNTPSGRNPSRGVQNRTAAAAAIRSFVARGSALVLPLLIALLLAGDRARFVRASAGIDMPALMVWAWDRDDDLRFLNTGDTGVAYLAATVTLRGDGVYVTPRHNVLGLPEGARLAAALHVESDRAEPPALSKEMSRRFVDVLAALAGDFPHHMLQIDFEAVASQRAFFIDALAALRLRLPGKPLSVTALASWCLTENWTGRLAADEVVPMLFRMGPDGRRIRAHFAGGGDFRAPSCRSSIGVATDELPNSLPPGRRVYVFSPRRWTVQAYELVRTRMGLWSHASLAD